jgi:hypothetical protein
MEASEARGTGSEKEGSGAADKREKIAGVNPEDFGQKMARDIHCAAGGNAGADR